MQTNLFAFLNELPEIATLNKSIHGLGLPIRFKPSFDLAKHVGGFVEVDWLTVPTPLEVWHDSTNTMEPQDRGLAACMFEVAERRTVLNWRWASWRAGCCVNGVCAALIHKFDAKVYSMDLGRFTTVEELMDEIRGLNLRNDSKFVFPFEDSRSDW